MDAVVILRREPSLIMLILSLLCLTSIASPYSYRVSGLELDDEENSHTFNDMDNLRVSELGSTREENLNCFLQSDQLIANKWTSDLDLGSNPNSKEPSTVVNRFQESEDDFNQRLAIDTRMMLDELKTCMIDVTKKLKNPVTEKCMKDLVANEIENDGFISIPELFDHQLPLPFLTFLNIREMGKVFYQNRTLAQLSPDEKSIAKKLRIYLKRENGDRDKVIVVDQSCSWKNLAALKKRGLEEDSVEEMLKEFKNQVIKLIGLQVSRGIFNAGDLKPGTWVTVYKRWSPVRVQNLKDLDSQLEVLKAQRFTTEELCGYATTLASFFAEQELKILIPERSSPLHLTTGDIEDRIRSKEASLCSQGSTRSCELFTRLKKSYEDDLRCMISFGKLLSNHILYSIVEEYNANIEPRITYPEIICKKTAPSDKIAIRYCRCVGSFCTTHDVGELNANYYKLTDGVVTRV